MPDNLTRTLREISAFWRNDHDDGFALRFTASTRPSVFEVDAAIAEALPRMLADAETDPAFPHSAVARLRHLAKLSKTGALGAADACAAALTIAWLVEAGVIDQAEYDGIQYMYDLGQPAKPRGTVH